MIIKHKCPTTNHEMITNHFVSYQDLSLKIKNSLCWIKNTRSLAFINCTIIHFIITEISQPGSKWWTDSFIPSLSLIVIHRVAQIANHVHISVLLPPLALTFSLLHLLWTNAAKMSDWFLSLFIFAQQQRQKFDHRALRFDCFDTKL